MSKKYVVISPWSKMLRDKSYNPKNYPYWLEVIERLKDDYDVVQIGIAGEEQLTEDFRANLSLKVIGELISNENCHTWIAVDNFLQHLMKLKGKPGIVLWGISDPNVFGYPENKNLLKSRKYLRDNQFYIWDGLKYNKNVFVDADVVIKAVKD